MYTISQLAKSFGLARSTLIYYDKKDILKPSGRTASNYRLYTEQDFKILQKICALRDAGVPVIQVREVLRSKASHVAEVLNQRLMGINQEINKLRNSQRLLVNLIGNKKLLRNTRAMNKEQWVALLRSAGLDEVGMQKWHQEFEKSVPDAHQDFLESLGLPAAEIKKIRHWSNCAKTPGSKAAV